MAETENQNFTANGSEITGLIHSWTPVDKNNQLITSEDSRFSKEAITVQGLIFLTIQAVKQTD